MAESSLSELQENALLSSPNLPLLVAIPVDQEMQELHEVVESKELATPQKTSTSAEDTVYKKETRRERALRKREERRRERRREEEQAIRQWEAEARRKWQEERRSKGDEEGPRHVGDEDKRRKEQWKTSLEDKKRGTM